MKRTVLVLGVLLGILGVVVVGAGTWTVTQPWDATYLEKAGAIENAAQWEAGATLMGWFHIVAGTLLVAGAAGVVLIRSWARWLCLVSLLVLWSPDIWQLVAVPDAARFLKDWPSVLEAIIEFGVVLTLFHPSLSRTFHGGT